MTALERPRLDRALRELYQDLHRHPELGFQEHRTAAVVSKTLTGLGFQVTTDVGGTGVVGVLSNGRGRTALLRAAMDGLPVKEETGLDYASTDTMRDARGTLVPVSHACGHDLHMTCLLGAARVLSADRSSWSGALVLVFQPAEELGAGAQAMVDDMLFGRFPVPDVVLGQHVAPLPAGTIAAHPGAAYASSDSLRVRLVGKGAHGSMPQDSIDPVVMAAETVLRLQTIISREIPSTETAVLTVGSIHAGDAADVIPGEAELQLNIRSYDQAVRQHVLDSVERIARAAAEMAGAPEPPVITRTEGFPVVVNDRSALERTLRGFAGWIGEDRIVDPGAGAGSEDVGILATNAGAPLAFWLLGAADPSLFTAGDLSGPALQHVPSNHSPAYAPAVEIALPMGVGALVTAAKTWLPPVRSTVAHGRAAPNGRSTESRVAGEPANGAVRQL
ncbi:amidohydrolase [Nocardioides dongkuii]|uniref:amidohydrolase n=1 Tax=Nocardioides dongkuii TaxID=2760089 RepID=UPI0015FC5ACD|nr:amidohydrolase [Nocardioides dongkuii]